MVEQDLRSALVQAGRDLHRQGMMAGASGNLSVRLGQDRVLLSPSGAVKGRLRPSSLLVVDMEGQVVNGEGRPSSETALHLAIYRFLPLVGAVVHAHPVYATALAAAHRGIAVDILPEALFALGSVACVPYLPPASSALGEAVAQALAGADGALLFNHGAVTVGTTVQSAARKMEVLEALAEVTVHACLVGGAVPLPVDEVERLRGVWRERRWG